VIPSGLDVDAETRRALEFDELLEQVARFACTRAGAAGVGALAPRIDVDEISAELQAVAEAREHLTAHGRLVPTGLPDPEPAFRRLTLAGAALDAKPLRDLATTLVAASELRRTLLAAAGPPSPRLRAAAQGLADLRAEAEPVLRHVDPEGRIEDSASAELTRVRRARARLAERLRALLRRLLADPGAGSSIQDEFITQRNERFVIPVRADAPRPVPGIVHARSSSGATRFVEPLETVELNNELVRLSEEERKEQERLLCGWADGLRRRLEQVERSLAVVAWLDGVQARALFQEESEAVLPQVDHGGNLVLEGVRHPLLDALLRRTGQRCVPLSLTLSPAQHVLVLSGPNAGGKTVALKTCGLLVLMAQSGIPVTGRAVRIPVFHQVRADIGDHQSIQANLSTYSAHVQAVVQFLAAARPPALFLFDEIGTGTDPGEGAALAQSILEALLVPGMTTLATTHQAALKVWSLTTESVATAALEFDAENLRPTYRVVAGAIGESAGLEIAERLGLAAQIVEAARRRLGADDAQGREYLVRLRALRAELEREGERAVALRLELERERERLQAEAEREAERRQREANDALERVLRDFRTRLAQELASFRDERERAWGARRLEGLERRAQAERARRQAEHVPAAVEAERPPVAADLLPGMRVFVRSFAREGEVVRVRGERVEVRMGPLTAHVARQDLGAAAARSSAASAAASPRRAGRTSPEPAAAPSELKLLGQTVEEARAALDRFLDQATLAGHSQVRVVHGHGSGRLRKAIRELLASHPQALRFRPGGEGEGGDGVTVVELA
jgi:DNA mismatch repair protein MutS2